MPRSEPPLHRPDRSAAARAHAHRVAKVTMAFVAAIAFISVFPRSFIVVGLKLFRADDGATDTLALLAVIVVFVAAIGAAVSMYATSMPSPARTRRRRRNEAPAPGEHP